MNGEDEGRPKNLGDLCAQLLDGVVAHEVRDPVLLQIYRQFRPGIVRKIQERVPTPCQDWER